MRTTIASHIRPTHNRDDVQRIVEGLRAMSPTPIDLVAHTVPEGKAQAYLEGLAFALEHGTFPPDQDLAPTDPWRIELVPAAATSRDARRIIQAARRAYGTCDVALLGLPAGVGEAFVEGLRERLTQEGKLP